ncbi:MAG: RNA methyltransferase [Alphaproteobacteria bacterium]
MRGYFGIGVEGVNKPYNVGNLFRSAHAFGAGFVFTVAATYERERGHRTDTSDSLGQVPFYAFPDAGSLLLPEGCRLVGIELMDEAIDLPSFRHPLQAAYILGPERGSLSPAMVARCDFVIKVPTRFSLNVGIAGVLVMYDRLLCRGRFAPRPVGEGGPTEGLPPHRAGGPVLRRMAPFREAPPLAEVALAEQAGGVRPRPNGCAPPPGPPR